MDVDFSESEESKETCGKGRNAVNCHSLRKPIYRNLSVDVNKDGY